MKDGHCCIFHDCFLSSKVIQGDLNTEQALVTVHFNTILIKMQFCTLSSYDKEKGKTFELKSPPDRILAKNHLGAVGCVVLRLRKNFCCPCTCDELSCGSRD